MCCRDEGPSPRARGKQHVGANAARPGGSIPASAGEARAAARRSRRTGVHPRERGGSREVGGIFMVRTGPSPRARGKPAKDLVISSRTGSIPASAGEAEPRHRRADRREVHPRERGGSDQPARALESAAGPSPRARGKPQVAFRPVRFQRSIPASAGEASGSRRGCPVPRVHPRERGGSSRRNAATISSLGPSPRARGKPGRSLFRHEAGRSIPASAGEAPLRRNACMVMRVHPRERGGSTSNCAWALMPRGPSPRARGKLVERLAFVAVDRSIPASAGEAHGTSTRWIPRRVHPRERGGSCERTFIDRRL